MSDTVQFETKTVYGGDALAAGQKVLEHRDPGLGKEVRKSRGLILLLSVILIFGGVTAAGSSVVSALILMLLGAAAAAAAVFYRQVLLLLAKRSATGEEETAAFYSERFFLKSTRREEGHRYDELTALCRSGHYLFLFVSKDRSYVVDEAGLRSGTPRELELFLTARTGLLMDEAE